LLVYGTELRLGSIGVKELSIITTGRICTAGTGDD